MHVLCCLAVAPGKVVSRNALLDAVWSKALVNEEALTHAVSLLRRVFGDEPKHARVIQTIHKTGYRLVQPVEWLGAEEPTAGGRVPASRRSPRRQPQSRQARAQAA